MRKIRNEGLGRAAKCFCKAWLRGFWLLVFGTLLLGAPLCLHAGAIHDRHIHEENARLSISVHYPQIGVRAIDDDVRHWAEGTVAQFKSEYGGEALGETRVPYQLDVTYEVIQPPHCLLSVVWTVASYTAGAHGQLSLVSYNYDAKTGQPVALLDVFEDLSLALNEISAFSYRELSGHLGDMRVENLLREGLIPEADNFSAFAVTPGGMRFYFSPYQVAPWAAGPQQVDVPLNILLPARPNLKLWGK